MQNAFKNINCRPAREDSRKCFEVGCGSAWKAGIHLNCQEFARKIGKVRSGTPPSKQMWGLGNLRKVVETVTSGLNQSSLLPLLPLPFLHHTTTRKFPFLLSTLKTQRFLFPPNAGNFTTLFNTFFPFLPVVLKAKTHRQDGSRCRYRLGYDVLLRRCLP